MASEAQRAACKRYYHKTKQNCRVFAIRLQKDCDADVIEALENAPSKVGYIRDLVRADIRRYKRW